MPRRIVPTRSRRRVLALALALVAVVGAACDREPRVAGEPAGVWAERLFENDPETRRAVGDRLAGFGAESVPALVAAAELDHAGARLEAARTLGRVGPAVGDAGARVLVRLLSDPNPGVRRTAIDALGAVGTVARSRLERQLDREPASRRRWAVRALAAMPAAAEEALARAAADPDAAVRAEAVAALGPRVSGSERARRAVGAALADDDWLVRERAARALATLGTEAPPALAGAREDPDVLVRLAAGAEPRAALVDALHALEVPDELLVGAYYYTWFPANWAQGYVGRYTRPPIAPALGEYSSADPRVLAQHAAWSRASGIDFWAVSWWPERPASDAALDAVARLERDAAPRFAALYESGDLGLTAGHVDFLPENAGRMVEHFRHLAERYFDHPRYLRVDGRPVVFVYVSRSFAGDFASEIARLRAALAELGHDVFLIGDEVFWQVQWGFETRAEPNVERVELFDAVTAYNPYESEERSHAGYAGLPVFLRDTQELYASYRRVAPGVPLVPGVLPGYNDRGTRLAVDHFVVPRRVEPRAPEGSTFFVALERLGLAQVDPRLPMMMITSFNEWNEGSQIEPTAPSPATVEDASPSGRAYTQGIVHAGYGGADLETLAAVLRRSPERLPAP